MNKINMMNYFHRVFLGWLATEISAGHVSPMRNIEAMVPIDLKQNCDLFDRFLRESSQEDNWRQLEAEHGTIDILTYTKG